MTGAALTQSGTPEAGEGALNLFLRAVWARLASGALLAALAAWSLAMVPFLRVALLIEAQGIAIGLSLLGVALAASPFILWAAARVFARGPNLLNPLWFWLFAVSAGAGVNTLALLFLRDSVVSVFVLAASGFAALHLAHRLAHQIPNWAAACIFLAVGLAGEWIITAVLAATWPFIALDLAAIGLLGLLIMLRAGAFPHIRQAMTRPRGKTGVTYAAMHLLTLADARVAQPSHAITKETKS